jgi:glycosyltransferase involved in cell wall biosynthesis
MSKCTELLNNIVKIVENDPSQLTPLLAGTSDILKMAKMELDSHRLIADNWEHYHKEFSKIETRLAGNVSPEEFCELISRLVDLLGVQDFYIELNRQTRTWQLDAPYDGSKVITAYSECQRFLDMISSGCNFALTWNNAENLVGLEYLLSSDIELLSNDNLFLGIPGPGSDPRSYFWYANHLPINSRLTPAESYKAFSFEEALASQGKEIKRIVIDKDKIEQDLPDVLSLAKGTNNTVFSVNAEGSTTEIIAVLWSEYPNNFYIDHRYFQEEPSGNTWLPDLTAVKRPEISAVMTLYKRPERLIDQLTALENQTLPPKDIFLFQDHINNGIYTIQLAEEIKKRFKNIHICDENVGVWGRFGYAANVCETEYVCLFDDDTIPGRRWLENCYMHMIQQEGIYVTLGVALCKEHNYPSNGGKWFRAGWGEPCPENAEVDFGGHSWFVKKEYLEPMADETLEFRKKYKYVGEDAYLSYSNLQRSDVRTYVPIHYAPFEEFYGSNRYLASISNLDNTAVSLNSNNLKSMHNMMEELKANNWEFVSERTPSYFEHIHELEKNVGSNYEVFYGD